LKGRKKGLNKFIDCKSSIICIHQVLLGRCNEGRKEWAGNVARVKITVWFQNVDKYYLEDLEERNGQGM
jgi:hypothetical protein